MPEKLELEEFLEPTQPSPEVQREQPPQDDEAEGAQQPSQPQEAPQEKPKKERPSLVLPVLITLLLLVGVGEAAFWGWFGLASYQRDLAQQRYEQQLAALQEERQSQGITGGSALGPWRKIENGTVTWQREEPLADSSVGQAEESSASEEGEKRLSSLYVPFILYALAEDDEPQAREGLATT